MVLPCRLEKMHKLFVNFYHCEQLTSVYNQGRYKIKGVVSHDQNAGGFGHLLQLYLDDNFNIVHCNVILTGYLLDLVLKEIKKDRLKILLGGY